MEIVYLFLDSIDSTNNYAKREKNHFAKEALTCIRAETQTKGRGRFERTWSSPAGVNLYLTFFFPLKKEFPSPADLTLVLANTLLAILQEEHVLATIKAPNDLLIDGKKLAGILAETTMDKKETYMILGIGINVNASEEMLANVGQSATSLLIETKRAWDRNRLCQTLTERFCQSISKNLS